MPRRARSPTPKHERERRPEARRRRDAEREGAGQRVVEDRLHLRAREPSSAAPTTTAIRATGMPDLPDHHPSAAGAIRRGQQRRTTSRDPVAGRTEHQIGDEGRQQQPRAPASTSCLRLDEGAVGPAARLAGPDGGDAANAPSFLSAERDPVAGLVGDRQEARVELFDGRLRVEVPEQLRVQPLGDRLDGDELVRAVVELVPDRVDPAVRAPPARSVKAGRRISAGELAPRLGLVRPGRRRPRRRRARRPPSSCP